MSRSPVRFSPNGGRNLFLTTRYRAKSIHPQQARTNWPYYAPGIAMTSNDDIFHSCGTAPNKGQRNVH